MPGKEFYVSTAWDDEAGVYYVEDSDLPGLVAEGETFEALRDKVMARVPELAVLNKHLIDWEFDDYVPVHLMAERLEKVRIPS